MPRPRETPYVWATWLAKLLAGENSCEWAASFRAHYQDWAKPPSDFDSTQWMLDHTALVNTERESREKLGYEVFTENQNSFRLRGRSATVAGKPDLIAVKGGDAVIIDAKTGKPGAHLTAPSCSSICTGCRRHSSSTEGQSFGATSSTRTETCRFPPAGWTRNSQNSWAVSSVDWHRRLRPGEYPAPGSAGSATSQQRTARRGWKGLFPERRPRTISEQCQLNMRPTSDFISSLATTAADTCPLMDSACPGRVEGTSPRPATDKGEEKRWIP